MRQTVTAAIITLLVSSPLYAQRIQTIDWSSQNQASALIKNITGSAAKGGPLARFKTGQQCPAPMASAIDPQAPTACAISQFVSDCGLFGTNCPQKMIVPMGLRDKGAVNPGFKALGGGGVKGSIDGPGRKGNGRYFVYHNKPYSVKLHIKTGYVDGAITLSRNKETGKDSMRFKGRYWDQGKGTWGPEVDGTNDVVITYNSRKDKGKISWIENGKNKSEGFWGGARGDDMTIELAGGWNHDFEQD